MCVGKEGKNHIWLSMCLCIGHIQGIDLFTIVSWSLTNFISLVILMHTHILNHCLYIKLRLVLTSGVLTFNFIVGHLWLLQSSSLFIFFETCNLWNLLTCTMLLELDIGQPFFPLFFWIFNDPHGILKSGKVKHSAWQEPTLRTISHYPRTPSLDEVRECLRTWSPFIWKCNFIQFLLNLFQIFSILSPHKVLCKSSPSTSFKVEAPKTIEISSLEEIPLSSTLHYILAKCKRIQKLLQVELYFLEFFRIS